MGERTLRGSLMHCPFNFNRPTLSPDEMATFTKIRKGKRKCPGALENNLTVREIYWHWGKRKLDHEIVRRRRIITWRSSDGNWTGDVVCLKSPELFEYQKLQF